ncbi:MAG: hypothetical protein ACAI34_00550 [Verrucomicrobium sp.]
MKQTSLPWLFSLCVAGSLSLTAHGQQSTSPAPAAPTAGVQGIQGVKQEAVANIKNVEPGVVTGAQHDPQGVNKINGVNAKGQAVTVPLTLPPPPPPPSTAATPPPPPPASTTTAVPPPPIVSAGGTAAPAGGGAIGSTASIQAVKGVSGISSPKLQNLEAALLIKNGADTPAGSGAEKGGKGRAAAAGLLSAPLGKPAQAPKEDGRAGFQEFEKLQNTGS